MSKKVARKDRIKNERAGRQLSIQVNRVQRLENLIIEKATEPKLTNPVDAQPTTARKLLSTNSIGICAEISLNSRLFGNGS